MNILFVDDEAPVLEGLRDALWRDRKRWHVLLANGGQAAAEILAKQPVDILVTDLRMPGMDGVDLLKHACQNHPLVVRISFSGYADEERVAAACALAHQQLVKPCAATVLREVVEHACAVQELLANAQLRSLLGTMGGLPSAPGTYGALSRAMMDERTSLQQLAAIIEKDVAVAARVLKFANSAYFGYGRRVVDIRQAVVSMGMTALRHLVLSIEVFQAIPGEAAAYCDPHVERHALLTARIARRLATTPHEQDAAFVAGLLHDVGKVALARGAPAQIPGIVAASRRPLEMVAAEREVLGADHTEVGAYLLGLWGLPARIFQAALHHHAPPDLAAVTGPSVADLSTLVRIAHWLAGRRAEAGPAAPKIPPEVLDAWSHIADEEREQLVAA